MKRKLTSIMFVSALLAVGASTFVSCKDTADDYYSDLKGQNADLAYLVEQQAEALKKQAERLDDYADEMDPTGNSALIEFIRQQAKDAKDAADAAQNSANANLKTIEELNWKIALIGAFNKEDGSIDITNENITLWGTSLKTVVNNAAQALALAKEDSARIDKLDETIKNHLIQATEYKGKVDELIQQAAELAAQDSILEEGYKQADLALNTKIETLNTELTNFKKEIYEYVDNLMTGVTIQATDNPVSGYVSLLGDVNINMVAAYYGYNGSSLAVNFPATNTAAMVDAADFVDFGEVEGALTVAGPGERIMNGSGNAGKIYVTVDPATTDFTGTKLRLVDSRGNAAPGFDNLTLKKSNRLLTFGGTRAGVNYLYEADATVTDDQAAKLDVDVNALKNVAQQLLNKLSKPQSNLNLTNVVATLYSQFNNALIKYNVEAENGNRILLGEYKVAATAIKPLSYNTFNNGLNVNLPRIPTLESMGLVFNEFTFDDMGHIEDVVIEIPDITAVEIKLKPGTTAGTVNMGNGEVTLNFENFQIIEGNKAKITVSMKEFNDMIDKLNEQMGGLLGSVNSMLDKFNQLAGTIDNSYIGRVNNFIERIENILQNPQSLLRITMLYQAMDGSYNQLSSVKEAPSAFYLNGKAEGAALFIPTSYTAELFAPSYKKVVKVLDGPSEAAVKTANDPSRNINKVLDGEIHNVMINFTEKGVYTIAYSSVDYHGKITTQKYYIEVK